MNFNLTNILMVLLLLFGSLFLRSSFAAEQTLVIPGKLFGKEVRNPYIDELLHLIYSKLDVDLTIDYSPEGLTQGRAMKALSDGKLINLNWSVTTKEREKLLLPIRIPIYKGLIGWRVSFIRAGEQENFSQVNNITDLQKFLAVQRFDWPDYKILLANDLNVEGNISFNKMYDAITLGLADYYPRSILEISREKNNPTFNTTGLSIERSLLIKYPSAYYFFVNAKDVALANSIEKGFKIAIEDGSFEDLFLRYYGENLKKLSLDKRRIIELNNPFFPSPL
ncbi:MAG: transporter substrate-binding domain-containing protein [Colwellia sp.]|nr:transporter substrate-binding domain-containing protein [Colwellia sp.]MCW8863354.1 transporter substrate-binding domain-containing protein [Colwellia sp.]MCW9080445.1 transporter substrate-binding domain-containing protein [Colwellia sp.]